MSSKMIRSGRRCPPSLALASFATVEQKEQDYRLELANNGTHLRVLSTMMSEIERVAPAIAVSASIANSFVSSTESRHEPSVLLRHYPRDSAIYLAVLRYFHRFDCDSAIDCQLQAYHSKLSTAKNLSLGFVLECKAATNEQSIQALQAAWRAMCRSALDLDTAIRKTLFVSVDEPPTSDVQVLLNLLQVAAAGDRPCISADGTIVVPARSDRRHHMRLQVNMPIRERRTVEGEPATLRDLSATGIGLVGIRNAKPGESLPVELPGGERMGSRVVWQSSDRLGAVLDEPLSSGDPLIGWALIKSCESSRSLPDTSRYCV